jgi:hypothetical protein
MFGYSGLNDEGFVKNQLQNVTKAKIVLAIRPIYSEYDMMDELKAEFP